MTDFSAALEMTGGRSGWTDFSTSLEMTKEHLPCSAVMAMPLTVMPMPATGIHRPVNSDKKKDPDSDCV